MYMGQVNNIFRLDIMPILFSFKKNSLDMYTAYMEYAS